MSDKLMELSNKHQELLTSQRTTHYVPPGGSTQQHL